MLTSRDFPPGTPWHHFFSWNERAWAWRDPRYRLARDPRRLPDIVAAPLAAAIGNPDPASHAAAFAAFEEWQWHPRNSPARILVIRLSAFGDFVQALGPIAAIRRRHAGDGLSLLTTRPLADFAAELGYFDEVLTDQRPGPFDFAAWLALRRRLRRARFDRVYDLQTSHRSAAYAWLLRPGLPQWSGVAWRCSHPHANRDRDRQHTLDKQAEQLLMAGIYPTPEPSLPPLKRTLPRVLDGQDFVLLVPGSSPNHPEKRWPAERFGEVSRILCQAGLIPVVVGAAGETELAAAIRRLCPAALDLVGQTDLGLLATLAQHAVLTIGNDTGACHLAAAAGCPVIVVFSGATDPERCAPRGRAVRVLSAPRLADLASERVIAAAASLLPGTGGRQPFSVRSHIASILSQVSSAASVL
jgi:ADP-heptose:LPS heptosyltransferase